MGFLKSLLIPLFAAAILYVAIALIILPFVRRHRARYSQYLPMTSGVAETTASWRTRMTDALLALFVPIRSRAVIDGSHGEPLDDELFDDEEGEGMVGFDPLDQRARAALDRERARLGNEDRRLSRELEEGFRDESDEEHDGTRTR